MLAARRMMLNHCTCVTTYSGCNTVTDAFNRADAGDHTLGYADTGERWANVPAGTTGVPAGFDDGYWTTQGTTVNTAQAQVPDLSRYRAMITVLNAGGNNQDITLDGECAANDHLRVFARCKPDLSFGYAVAYSANGPGIWKIVNGVHVSLSSAMPTIALSTPFTARVTVKDNNLKVYLNGTLEANLTIDPDDANCNCETNWTYAAIGQDHGGSGGSAPTQTTVYTDTHWDNLSVVAP